MTATPLAVLTSVPLGNSKPGPIVFMTEFVNAVPNVGRSPVSVTWVPFRLSAEASGATSMQPKTASDASSSFIQDLLKGLPMSEKGILFRH
jgi:hypothetical protein